MKTPLELSEIIRRQAEEEYRIVTETTWGYTPREAVILRDAFTNGRTKPMELLVEAMEAIKGARPSVDYVVKQVILAKCDTTYHTELLNRIDATLTKINDLLK